MKVTDANRYDICRKLEDRADRCAIRIYTIIRAAGRGEMTSDNALLRLAAEYDVVRNLQAGLLQLTDYLASKIKEVA